MTPEAARNRPSPSGVSIDVSDARTAERGPAIEGPAWRLSSTVSHLPPDPAGEAAAEAITEIIEGAVVEVVYSPADAPPPPEPDSAPTTATATGEGLAGWRITWIVRLDGPLAGVLTESAPLLEILDTLPGAALRAATLFRADPGGETPKPFTPSMRRALRDTLVTELLGHLPAVRGAAAPTELIGETIEYMIELSGTRVESREVTHGVVIADVFTDKPRLVFEYPADLRPAKRAPLLFDGQRSLLLVDKQGHARFEIQRHRLDKLRPGSAPAPLAVEFVESGSLVAEATGRLGGLGLFLRADRTIWVFVGGQPLLLRRGAHWTAFPLELTAFVASLIGGGRAAGIVVQAAYILSARAQGAILAIVDDRDSLEGIVAPKDRYDLRNEFDHPAMRPETRLHHLIDADDLDAQTLARLAGLDGATIVDRDADLLAYGAIVNSSDSQQEGARTAAAKSLSQTADVVLMVSQDGDITVFHAGTAVATLLGRRPGT
jgi:DisA bacterial checkpoint controller nucleotide-binding